MMKEGRGNDEDWSEEGKDDRGIIKTNRLDQREQEHLAQVSL